MEIKRLTPKAQAEKAYGDRSIRMSFTNAALTIYANERELSDFIHEYGRQDSYVAADVLSWLNY